MPKYGRENHPGSCFESLVFSYGLICRAGCCCGGPRDVPLLHSSFSFCSGSSVSCRSRTCLCGAIPYSLRAPTCNPVLHGEAAEKSQSILHIRYLERRKLQLIITANVLLPLLGGAYFQLCRDRKESRSSCCSAAPAHKKTFTIRRRNKSVK